MRFTFRHGNKRAAGKDVEALLADGFRVFLNFQGRLRQSGEQDDHRHDQNEKKEIGRPGPAKNRAIHRAGKQEFRPDIGGGMGHPTLEYLRCQQGDANDAHEKEILRADHEIKAGPEIDEEQGGGEADRHEPDVGVDRGLELEKGPELGKGSHGRFSCGRVR